MVLQKWSYEIGSHSENKLQSENQRQQGKNGTVLSRPHQHHHQKKMCMKEAPPLIKSVALDCSINSAVSFQV
jgi:hypothetical protein